MGQMILKSWRGVLLLVSVAGLFPRASPAADGLDAEINQAIERLYNADYQKAHGHLDRYVGAQPDDPLGYSLRASAFLFSELDRLGILESEFFADDKRIIEKKRLKPDPAVKQKLFATIDEAQVRATKVLAEKSDDQNALFCMAVTQGITMDYTALVEKRQLSSLSSARRSNGYAQRLLKINPQFYDAYLTTGFSEYLLASLPFYVRWFVHFDDVSGSKDRAIHNLQLVAKWGRYLKPFARIMLAIVYLREKQPLQTRALLAELASEYPKNELIRKELSKVTAQIEGGAVLTQ